MAEEIIAAALRDLVEQIRQLNGRLEKIENQITRLSETGEFFVRRARRSDERLAEELARQRMSRDPFSD